MATTAARATVAIRETGARMATMANMANRANGAHSASMAAGAARGRLWPKGPWLQSIVLRDFPDWDAFYLNYRSRCFPQHNNASLDYCKKKKKRIMLYSSNR